MHAASGYVLLMTHSHFFDFDDQRDSFLFAFHASIIQYVCRLSRAKMFFFKCCWLFALLYHYTVFIGNVKGTS